MISLAIARRQQYINEIQELKSKIAPLQEKADSLDKLISIYTGDNDPQTVLYNSHLKYILPDYPLKKSCRHKIIFILENTSTPLSSSEINRYMHYNEKPAQPATISTVYQNLWLLAKDKRIIKKKDSYSLPK